MGKCGNKIMGRITLKIKQKCPLQTNKNLLIANLFDREGQNYRNSIDRKVDLFNMPKKKKTGGKKYGK